MLRHLREKREFLGSSIEIDATTSTWKTGNFRGSNIQIDAMILDENWIM